MGDPIDIAVPINKTSHQNPVTRVEATPTHRSLPAPTALAAKPAIVDQNKTSERILTAATPRCCDTITETHDRCRAKRAATAAMQNPMPETVTWCEWYVAYARVKAFSAVSIVFRKEELAMPLEKPQLTRALAR